MSCNIRECKVLHDILVQYSRGFNLTEIFMPILMPSLTIPEQNLLLWQGVASADPSLLGALRKTVSARGGGYERIN